MKEIEIKARVPEMERIKEFFETHYGEGHPVHKSDHYFRRPGERVQALRIRRFNGNVELTTKKTSVDRNGESNEEYEFRALPDQEEAAVSFFHALGYEDFFIKKKDGYEWMAGRSHVELLSVNSLGWFLEIEILLPFDADRCEEEKAREEIASLIARAGLDESDYESRSYREMILESENGIQS